MAGENDETNDATEDNDQTTGQEAKTPEAEDEDADLDLLTDEEREAMGLNDNGEEDVPPVVEEEEVPEDTKPPETQKPDTEEPAKEEDKPDAGQLDAELEAMRQKRKDIIKQYQEGDLDDEEFDAAMEAYDQEKEDLIGQAALARKDQEAAMEAWTKDVQGYMEKVPDLWNETHLDGFDLAVRRITGNPRYDGLSNEAKLELAHKHYAIEAEALGLEAPSAPSAKTAKKETGLPETTTETAPNKQAPRTLRDIPASEVPAQGGNAQFDALDRLQASGDVDAYEEALAKLPESVQEQYANYTGGI